MSRIAFMTFGILDEPQEHPVNEDFKARSPLVFDASEAAPGFIDRSRVVNGESATLIDDRDCGLWSMYVTPRFYQGSRRIGKHRSAQTLSLWTDLNSVYIFAYQGEHLAALRKRKEWFLTPQWPTYVVWWVADDFIPTWLQACERLEHLYDQGATAYAFDFKHPFDAQGVATIPPYDLRQRISH